MSSSIQKYKSSKNMYITYYSSTFENRNHPYLTMKLFHNASVELNVSKCLKTLQKRVSNKTCRPLLQCGLSYPQTVYLAVKLKRHLKKNQVKINSNHS